MSRSNTIIFRAVAATMAAILVAFVGYSVQSAMSQQGGYDIKVSLSPDRSASVPLHGETVDGLIYVFTSPDSGVSKVQFYLDDPSASGSPFQTEGKKPYDFAGTASNGTANPFDTASLSDGPHSITAKISSSSGTYIITSNFTVGADAPQILLSDNSLSITLKEGQTADRTVTVSTSDSLEAQFLATENVPWADADPANGTVPAGQTVDVTVSVDSTGLTPGSYNTNVVVGADGYTSASLPLNLIVQVGYDILLSTQPDRTGPVPLQGESVTGNIYVFTSPTQNVTRVDFFYDDVDMTGSPIKIELSGPFDFAGTLGDGSAAAFNTASQTPGAHTITAKLTLAGGAQEVISAAFTIGVDVTPELLFGTDVLSFNYTSGPVPAPKDVSLNTNDATIADFTIVSDQTWAAPSPLTGSTPDNISISVNPTGLGAGIHTATITASADGYVSDSVTVSLTIGQEYDLLLSNSPDRSASVPLDGQTVSGLIYAFTGPDAGVSSVSFYIDDVGHTGPATKVENLAPYDLGGTNPDFTAAPFNTSALTDGLHTLTAVLSLSSGGQLDITATFTSDNFNPALQFTPSSVSLAAGEGAPIADQNVTLGTNDGTTATFDVTESSPWLTVSPTTGDTPGQLTLSFDETLLSTGANNASVTATAPGFDQAVLNVSVTVSTAGSGGYGLVYSVWSDRFDPSPLEGATVTGNIYAFTTPDMNVTQVRFYLNDLPPLGAPIQTENTAPFDFAGGTVSTANAFNTANLPDGQNRITAELDIAGGTTETVTADFTVVNGSPGLTFSSANLQFAFEENDPASSKDAILSAFDGSSSNFSISESASWLTVSPTNGVATPATITFTADPTGLGPGTYSTTVTANSATLPSGTLNVTMTIGGGSGDYNILVSQSSNRSNATLLEGQTLSDEIYVFVSPESSISQVRFYLDNPTMSGTATKTENTAPWDFQGGTAAAAAPFNTATVTDGLHTLHVQVDVSGAGTQVLSASFETANGCNPIACSEIRVSLPYNLTFNQDHGKIVDDSGVGTGFTFVVPPAGGGGYVPANIDANIANGTLDVSASSGAIAGASDSLDNILTVGLDAPSQIITLSTTILNVPAGTGNGEEAGMFLGVDQNNYVSLSVVSTPSGLVIDNVLEVDGSTQDSDSTGILGIAGSDLLLTLRADPTNQTISASYSAGGEALTPLGTFTAPSEFFSFDGAGLNPIIGTRTFGGIFAVQGTGGPIVYSFDEFTGTGQGLPTVTSGDLTFAESSHNVTFPTSLVWGPDGRLYVTEMFGTIHALTYDENMQVTNDQVINTLTNSFGAARLTLGITIDPASTANNVILWVSSSNGSVNNGLPNTGAVSRLSGPNFGTIEHVITGLPRAIANHAINSIEFGPDGRLYMAHGGNTGAGAPNTSNTEFGDMEEQPLSASINVADVFAAGFDGSCNNPNDIFGPPPCDVVPFATGLRNAYDLVWHSNGSMYAPDNGLGVTGTYPPSPTPPCFGLASTSTHNPGTQPDWLYRVTEGAYHGHPNPYRDECVWGNGSKQGVAPLPNYVPGIWDLGQHKSANGIVEYTSDAFCGALQGDLLIANYSSGDNITRVKLSPTGLTVVDSETLVGGFNNPLPLAMGPNGTIFVGEHGGNQVTALKPVESGCWTTLAPAPAQILDAGGVALGGKLYMVGGKNSSTHLSTMYIYDPATNSWSTGPNLPGEAVENPALAAFNGKLYAFGGSTGPFSGAVTNAAVYTPGGGWQSLPPMTTGRGGATAQVANGLIYVIGGMDGSGASLSSVEVFNPTNNTWGSAASMSTRRDNPGSAVLNGNIYVFGGRTRNSDGSTVNGTLASVEMYDSGTDSWVARASMPTGRRTMVVGTIDGKAQVMGGEATSGGGSFAANEEYDPTTNSWRTLVDMQTPRHGAAGGTINNVVYVAGGGPTAGSSFTDVLEAFTFPGGP